MLRFLIAALLLTAGAPAQSAAEESPHNYWFVGVWDATYDEDHTPLDTWEFRGDKTWVVWASDCTRGEGKFHAYGGDIYITSEVPGKGPIALVYHPSSDHSKLTFTSPRTHNNATYERSKRREPRCAGA